MKNNNWVSKFTSFFLARRQISLVLFLFLLAGGTVALFGLRREGFPQVPVKVIVINTIYRGAAAHEIEQSITNPIESAVKDVKEVKSLSSTSSESSSVVVATLDEGADTDASIQSITSKVASIELPKDAEKPSISQPATGGSAFVFGLTGPFTAKKLLEQGKIFEREVSQIKGIKQVQLDTKFVDQINVTFDPAKISSNAVDVSRLATSLSANNLNFPIGQNLTLDGSRATALIAARITSLEQLGDTPVPTITGRSVRLADIATITRGINQSGRINHIGVREGSQLVAKTGLVYNIDITSTADILTTDENLTQTLDRLQSNGTLDKSLTITRLIDSAKSTSDQIHEIKAGAIGEKWEGLGPLGYAGFALGGIWLLMLAMFLFVNLRTAIIAGVAIPLSFLFTLLSLYFAGITLNTLTLFSMILVLGLVVDPAIVVLESIQRYRDMGHSGSEGIKAAINSIGPGLLLATICSIIVFTPFGIVSGVFGQIIKYIPVTVIPALIASFFVPLVFLAPLADKLMKARRVISPATASATEDDALWPVSRWFKRANLYILRRLWLQIIIILIAVIAPLATTGYLFGTKAVKSAQFSKPKDATEALVNVTHPANFTDAQIADLAQRTELALNKFSEIKDYYYYSQDATNFNIYVNFTPIKDRDIVADDLVKQIQPNLPQDAAKKIYSSAKTLSVGPPEGDFPVQLQIHESDLSRLQKFTRAVATHASSLSGVTRVSDDYADNSPSSVQVTINKDAATARGLNAAAIGAQLAGLLGQNELTKVVLGDDQLSVIAQYQGTDRYNTLTALSQAPINTANGPIPLNQIATLSTDSLTGTIRHQDGQRFATIKAGVASDADAFAIQRQINDWAKAHLAEYGLRDDALESKGEGDEIAKSFTNLFMALGIAVLLVYLVLAVFFNSFLKPIIITFALPLSFLGVFPSLALLGNEFGFLEILGLITLAGIVVNVGIFVIDYANRQVAAGVPVKEAVAQATAVRFRPIFLTKVVALGSLLPLAILSPFWRGLATVIIAGILASGVLSLFTTPILYVWFTRLSALPNWIRQKIRPQSPTPPTPPATRRSVRPRLN